LADQLVTSEDAREEELAKKEEEDRIREAEEKEQIRLFDEERARVDSRVEHFDKIYDGLKTSANRLQVENVETINKLLVQI
jgi:hypothetical protein